MASAKSNQLISLERPHLGPHSTAKTVQISVRMAYIGISDVWPLQYTPRKPV